MRDLDRHDAALLLDGYLRILARQEAMCRRVLGKLAAVFLRQRAHHRLSFRRLGDYTRERLGLSARELQSTAHVATKLEALPALARAFETGMLSWTHARALVDVVTCENEVAWVACARTLTVRALERCIGAGRTPRDNDPPAAGEAAPSGDVAVETPRGHHPAAIDADDGGTLDGEPTVRIRIGCPRRVRALWRATVELARRMAGEPLPLWQACEAIAAEGLTSPAARCHTSGESGAAPFAVDDAEAGPGAETAVDERRTDAFSFVDWEAVADALPAPVAPVGDDFEALDAFALDARMRDTLAAMHRVHWQTGRLLRLVFDLRLSLAGVPDGRAVRERAPRDRHPHGRDAGRRRARHLARARPRGGIRARRHLATARAHDRARPECAA